MQAIDELVDIMACLRDRNSGCPWDREQTSASLIPCTIEEAYEVADAIDRGAVDDVRDELGDLLFQVVFHAQIAAEGGDFDLAAVARGLAAKLVRRHPHALHSLSSLADAAVPDAGAQAAGWEGHQATERAARVQQGTSSRLDGVALALPAMTRAYKLQQRAAEVGFDWRETSAVLGAVGEELAEVREALELGSEATSAALMEEIGDLMFACVNLARFVGLDPEMVLRRANSKFEARFRFIEGRLANAGRGLGDSDLAEMDALWDQAKAEGY
ncbi:MAG: nucleoside triphosphate pyrophosphohydrolase [Gammaproteobacteria bacterium]